MSDVAGASTSANDLDVASSVERTPERAREDDVDDEASPSSASSVEDAMRRLALVDASNELARDARRARYDTSSCASSSHAVYGVIARRMRTG